MGTVLYRRIGSVRSPYSNPKDIPKGPPGHEIKGVVEVLPRYRSGLDGLRGFSHIVLITHLHLSERPLMRVTPRGERSPRGVFSTRSPRRPNPIGMTVVRLDSIEEGRLLVTGVDLADRTPLLDIKPCLPEQDWETGVSTGRRGRKRPGRPAASDNISRRSQHHG